MGPGYSRHFARRHKYKDFRGPFACPACKRQKKEDVWFLGLDAWLLHAREVYGIDSRGLSVSEELKREKKRTMRDGRAQRKKEFKDKETSKSQSDWEVPGCLETASVQSDLMHVDSALHYDSLALDRDIP